jgi:hypothetical protein
VGRPAATPGRGALAHYAAFDVSGKETAIHVPDGHGRPVCKGKRPGGPGNCSTRSEDGLAL